ncbi:sensor histidine kinase [Deinococcus malanensis]|uniref:sensor histidine kinase n=1 Tax=Deinococcus malanensis TaxID=1706855 RepID=UPI0036442292
MGELIQSETGRLLALVQQMADAHRFEREDVKIQPELADLRGLLSGVVQRLESQARSRGVALSVHGTGSACVDSAVLERAVTNLADNAVRFAQTRVQLRIAPQGIAVLDDGPGLQAPLEDLAQPFNSQPTTIAGQQYTAGTAGLGLYITRRIAEAHGGQLLYERHHHPLPGSDTSASLPSPAAGHTALSIVLPEVLP